MSNDLAVQTIGNDLATVEDLVRNVDVIKQAMKSVMIGPSKDEDGKDVPGMHYGTIPGCGDKYALFQPGAHKLGLLFNLAPEYDIEVKELAGEHREYEVTCRLTHRATSRFVGQGVGVCSTRETKYRFRSENTGEAVPKEYWAGRDQALIGGPGYAVKKLDGKWVITHRVAHDNPADYYNTVKKIAKKRAYNDAILTATAASDIFAPDDDTDPEFTGDDAGAGRERPPVQQPQSRSAGNGDKEEAARPGPINETQAKLLRNALKKHEISEKELCAKFDVKTLDHLQFAQLNNALAWVADPK